MFAVLSLEKPGKYIVIDVFDREASALALIVDLRDAFPDDTFLVRSC